MMSNLFILMEVITSGFYHILSKICISSSLFDKYSLTYKNLIDPVLFRLMLIKVRISKLTTQTNNSSSLAIFIGIIFGIAFQGVIPSNSSINNEKYNLLLNKRTILDNLEVVNYFSMNKNDVFFVNSQTWDGMLAEFSHITNIGNIIVAEYGWLIITVTVLMLIFKYYYSRIELKNNDVIFKILRTLVFMASAVLILLTLTQIFPAWFNSGNVDEASYNIGSYISSSFIVVYHGTELIYISYGHTIRILFVFLINTQSTIIKILQARYYISAYTLFLVSVYTLCPGTMAEKYSLLLLTNIFWLIFFLVIGYAISQLERLTLTNILFTIASVSIMFFISNWFMGWFLPEVCGILEGYISKLTYIASNRFTIEESDISYNNFIINYDLVMLDYRVFMEVPGGNYPWGGSSSSGPSGGPSGPSGPSGGPHDTLLLPSNHSSNTDNNDTSAWRNYFLTIFPQDNIGTLRRDVNNYFNEISSNYNYAKRINNIANKLSTETDLLSYLRSDITDQLIRQRDLHNMITKLEDELLTHYFSTKTDRGQLLKMHSLIRKGEYINTQGWLILQAYLNNNVGGPQIRAFPKFKSYFNHDKWSLVQRMTERGRILAVRLSTIEDVNDYYFWRNLTYKQLLNAENESNVELNKFYKIFLDRYNNDYRLSTVSSIVTIERFTVDAFGQRVPVPGLGVNPNNATIYPRLPQYKVKLNISNPDNPSSWALTVPSVFRDSSEVD